MRIMDVRYSLIQPDSNGQGYLVLPCAKVNHINNIIYTLIYASYIYVIDSNLHILSSPS